MSNDFSKYNSVPFSEYFLKKCGNEIVLDNLNKLIKINDGNGYTISTIYLSANINHQIKVNELLSNADNKDKVYYVYENGHEGRDWLWHYGDLISINELL